MPRNCVHSGELQVKIQKKSGTLRLKKKFVFGDELWVALCVHDNKIPLLEWYAKEASISSHEPLKVEDLLMCLFVNQSLRDDRCFTIGFTDENRPTLEFSAQTAQQCKFWVSIISSTLKRLNCLHESENIYSEFLSGEIQNPAEYSSHIRNIQAPSVSPPPTPRSVQRPPTISPTLERKRINLSDQIPIRLTNEAAAETSNCQREGTSPVAGPSCTSPLKLPVIHHQQKKDSETSGDLTPPPLPPRTPRTTDTFPSTSSPPQNGASTKIRGKYQYDFPQSPPANYDMLSYNSQHDGAYSLLNFSHSLGKSLEEEHLYGAETRHQLTPNISSQSESRASTSSESQRSNPDENSYLAMGPQQRLPKSFQYDGEKCSSVKNNFTNIETSSSTLKTISLLLTICIEDISFAEVGNKIWITGWNPVRDNLLKNLIHFGDEVVQIGNEPVRNINQIPALFYANSLPGMPIEIVIRPIPNGSTYSIAKPLNPKKSLGIAFHKKTNTIVLNDDSNKMPPNSPKYIGDNAQVTFTRIPSKVPAYFFARGMVMSDKNEGSSSDTLKRNYTITEVPAVITEVDGIPLNPFAKNEQFFQRLERFSQGTVFTVIIHPLDFVDALKDSLKLNKNYKRTIHDC
ncbi:hypothetical protein Ddc_05677 [Ditylenchus destructor]|nr:hypothetical protein Ddc_05677 [Ditylenchus destructor]